MKKYPFGYFIHLSQTILSNPHTNIQNLLKIGTMQSSQNWQISIISPLLFLLIGESNYPILSPFLLCKHYPLRHMMRLGTNSWLIVDSLLSSSAFSARELKSTIIDFLKEFLIGSFSAPGVCFCPLRKERGLVKNSQKNCWLETWKGEKIKVLFRHFMVVYKPFYKGFWAWALL